MADESLPSSLVVEAPDPAVDIDKIIRVFLAEQAADLLALDPALESLISAATQAIRGGKRLRPAFAHWGFRAVAGPDGDGHSVMPALAALELLHAFALVHDDIMDGSESRRGRPTAHRGLAAEHSRLGWRGDAARFGLSGAILAGDLFLVWADRLMSQAAIAPTALIRARQVYDLMRVQAIAGQFLDVLGESAPEWSLDRSLRTAQLKTASYTVTQPLLFGAALAGVDTSPVETGLIRYGQSVGVAFQLRDDLLGVYGDPATTGKPVGEDLLRAKPTVLLQLARALASRAQSVKLDRLLAAGDVPRATSLIRETGAVAQLDQMIAQRIAGALDALDTTPIDPCAKGPLTRLAAAAAWRTA